MFSAKGRSGDSLVGFGWKLHMSFLHQKLRRVFVIQKNKVSSWLCYGFSFSKRILHFARGLHVNGLIHIRFPLEEQACSLPLLFKSAFLNESCQFVPSENLERCYCEC